MPDPRRFGFRRGDHAVRARRAAPVEVQRRLGGLGGCLHLQREDERGEGPGEGKAVRAGRACACHAISPDVEGRVTRVDRRNVARPERPDMYTKARRGRLPPIRDTVAAALTSSGLPAPDR